MSPHIPSLKAFFEHPGLESLLAEVLEQVAAAETYTDHDGVQARAFSGDRHCCCVWGTSPKNEMVVQNESGGVRIESWHL